MRNEKTTTRNALQFQLSRLLWLTAQAAIPLKTLRLVHCFDCEIWASRRWDHGVSYCFLMSLMLRPSLQSAERGWLRSMSSRPVEASASVAFEIVENRLHKHVKKCLKDICNVSDVSRFRKGSGRKWSNSLRGPGGVGSAEFSGARDERVKALQRSHRIVWPSWPSSKSRGFLHKA